MKETHYISKLSAFVDRELSKDEQQTVGEHLMVCADCRREHDRIKFASGLAAALPRSDAPSSVWASIQSGLIEHKGGETITRDHFPMIAGYATACIFLIAFVALGYLFLASGEPYRTEQAKIETPVAIPVPANVEQGPADLPQTPHSNVTQTAGSATVGPSAPAAAPASAVGSFEFETISGRPTVGAASTSSNLSVGDYMETDATSRARIEVASIGNVEIRPNSRVKLVRTSQKEHRLALERGSLHAKIFAPPRLFIVDTPSATAVDLGCEYTLDVDNEGNNRLHVTSGFVALEAGGRESIVPAGAICLTKKGKGLGTPFSAETSEKFRAALERFDFAGGGSGAVDVMLARRGFYDMVSLWHLLSRVDRSDRGRIYEALAAYVAPPDSVTKDGIISLNKKMLESWREEVERAWFDL